MNKTNDLLVAIDELTADMDAPDTTSSGGLDLDNVWNEEQPEHLVDLDSVDADLSRAGEAVLRGNLLDDPE